MSIVTPLNSPVHRLRQAGAATAHHLLSARDCAILDFLWLWKVATTATIHAATGADRTAYATYLGLVRLERLKLIEARREDRRHFHYWQLTKKGYQVIREDLGDLKEEGFKSENVWHDLNVVGFQLGDWAKYPDAKVELYTEQQLRRKSEDNYPDWVPKFGYIHRADGLARFQAPKKPWIFAYEVELSAKSIARYESIIRYYRMIREFDLVYWLVGSPEVKAAIVKAKTNCRDSDDNYHLFVDQAEYIQVGWKAVATNHKNEKRFSIEENVRGILGEQPTTCQRIAQEKLNTLPYFDPRKALRIAR